MGGSDPNHPVILTKKGERYAAENAHRAAGLCPKCGRELWFIYQDGGCARMDCASTAEGPQGASVDHTLTDRMRAAVEDLERLAEEVICTLDILQGDADLEPVLGAPEIYPFFQTQAFRDSINQARWARGGDVDEREPGDDEEPSLGSLHGTAASGTFGNQERWAQGSPSDLEDEHDGREPQCEDEGGACEDEGADIGDLEPDHDHELCAWASGEVDQRGPLPPETRLTGIDYVDSAGLEPWDRLDGR